MLTREQIHEIEHSYKHSDCLVFSIESGDHTRNRVFIVESDDILKHKKEATVEMRNCLEVDETCFENDGSYHGDFLNTPLKTIILSDPRCEEDWLIESIYYEDEIREIL